MQNVKIAYNDIDLSNPIAKRNCPRGHPMDFFWNTCPKCKEEKQEEKEKEREENLCLLRQKEREQS